METRQWPNLTLRLSEATPGQFDGIAVPYGTQINMGGYRESVARGAIDPTTLVGAPILWQHDTKLPVGRIKSASSVRDGLHITGEFNDTSWGKDAHAAIASDSVSGLSIGFEPLEHETDKHGAITHTKMNVREVSIATLPAYPDARVTAVRTEEGSTMPDTPAVTTPPADIVTRADLEALESRMRAAVAPPVAARTLGVVEAFTEQLRGSAKDRQLRALADVISTGNSGVLPPSWSSEVRNFVDRQRYMIPQAGSIGFPDTGYTLTIPKVLTHTLVAARGAQKTEIPSRALTTGQDTYTATWYAGGVDVALEIIWQSSPSIWEIVVADLLQQYAEVTDTAFSLAVATAGQPTGAVLPVTGYAAFIAAVLTQAENIRNATGQFGDRLSLTTATWGKLIGFVDADGRRIVAPGNPTNSDGTAALLERSVNLGGILAFHNPRALEDVLFNQVSVRVAEKPPVTITQDVVALMGRDVGVLGAMMDVLYPAGIKTFSVTE